MIGDCGCRHGLGIKRLTLNALVKAVRYPPAGVNGKIVISAIMNQIIYLTMRGMGQAEKSEALLIAAISGFFRHAERPAEYFRLAMADRDTILSSAGHSSRLFGTILPTGSSATCNLFDSHEFIDALCCRGGLASALPNLSHRENRSAAFSSEARFKRDQHFIEGES